MIKLDFSHVKGDIFGGVTAAVVALPLALAFGVASGAGPVAGLYGAILVGFFASLFGGTATNVSGPTGPMVVVFAGLFASLSGKPELVFTAVILAGVLQIIFGVLKFGEYIRLVPYPVVSGFMSGIGAIIIILQVGRILGAEPPGDTIMALAEIPKALVNPNWSAVIVGGVALVVGYLWPSRLSRYLPGPLAALIVATIVSLFLPNTPLLGLVPTGLPEMHWPVFTNDSTYLILEAAFILAVLGAIDSLLTSLVADNMTRTQHDSNKELIGQGIGNAVAGFFSAIPGAGATMRTVINIRSGGRTNLSGIIHAIVLLAMVLGLGSLASYIPHAALAGILVKVGVDIVDWAYIKRAHRGPRWDLVLMALVLALTVFVDLITAVASGVILAALAFVRQVAQVQLASIEHDVAHRHADPEEALLLEGASGRVTVFDFGGPLSFGAAADMGHQFREKVRKGVNAIILDFSRVPFIDVSSARAVETITCDAEHSGKQVYFSGANESVTNTLSALKADCCMSDDRRFDNRIDAIKAAVNFDSEGEEK